MTEDDHRREHDHLVEPLYGALPERDALPQRLALRTGMWCVAIVVTALLLQYFG